MKTIEITVLQKHTNPDGSRYYLVRRVIDGFIVEGFFKIEQEWALGDLVEINAEQAEKINWKA